VRIFYFRCCHTRQGKWKVCVSRPSLMACSGMAAPQGAERHGGWQGEDSEPTSAFGHLGTAMLEHVNEIRRVSVLQDKRRRAADACRAMSTAPAARRPRPRGQVLTRQNSLTPVCC